MLKNLYVQAFIVSAVVYVLLRLGASSLVILSGVIIMLEEYAYYAAAVAGAIYIVVAGVMSHRNDR